MLRLALVPTNGTNFYVPCPHCSVSIRGYSLGLELADHTVNFDRAERIDLKDYSDLLSVTVDPNVPLNPQARSVADPFVGAGPNITLVALFGGELPSGAESVSTKFRKMAMLRNSVEHSWPDYRDALQYYIAEQWELFEAAIDRLIDVDWTDSGWRAAQRRRMAHLVFQLIIAPSYPDSLGVDLFADYEKYALPAFNNPQLRQLAVELESSGRLASIENNLYRAIIKYFDVFEKWFPGLIIRLTDPAMTKSLEDLRICGDDFSELSALYQQCCEVCCDGFSAVVVITNTSLRSDPQKFGDPTDELLSANAKEKSPQTLSAFDKLVCKKRLAYATEWPVWRLEVPRLLDLSMRNSIAHADARHDLPTGKVVSKGGAINYGEFLGKVFDLNHPLFLTTQAVKSLRIIAEEEKI